MARILAISSQVARGTVGLSIIVPALQALGHEVIAMPTVALSNHPGHANVAGTRIEATVLFAMLDALEANGWLRGLEAVLTGYLPSVEHVRFAAEAVRRVKAANGAASVTYICDPVLGDDPKGLYIDEAAARALRSALVPVSDVTTPNRFELSYLSGLDVRTPDDALRAAHGGVATFATSVPSTRADELLNVMIADGQTAVARVTRRARAPHGTGDLFSALVLSAWLARRGGGQANGSVGRPLAFATAGVDAVLDGGLDADVLAPTALPRPAMLLDWPVVLIGPNGGSAPWA
ncbi:MAG: pyridoxal kinase [Hyphomicrobiaceae bacterium]|nr:pyridoxal kinase [Hyphomicrobiaceae bacterium]